eukprot:3725544-Prymnesium_polylepis.1
MFARPGRSLPRLSLAPVQRPHSRQVCTAGRRSGTVHCTSARSLLWVWGGAAGRTRRCEMEMRWLLARAADVPQPR